MGGPAWHMLGSGLFGLILYQTIPLILPGMGSTTMLGLIIVGRLCVGLLIDHFGWFGVSVRPLDLTRLAGVAVLLLGGYLIAR
ncbi:MAG: DMT family transporter [Anaerolineales bacterium]